MREVLKKNFNKVWWRTGLWCPSACAYPSPTFLCCTRSMWFWNHRRIITIICVRRSSPNLWSKTAVEYFSRFDSYMVGKRWDTYISQQTCCFFVYIYIRMCDNRWLFIVRCYLHLEQHRNTVYSNKEKEGRNRWGGKVSFKTLLLISFLFSCWQIWLSNW